MKKNKHGSVAQDIVNTVNNEQRAEVMVEFMTWLDEDSRRKSFFSTMDMIEHLVELNNKRRTIDRVVIKFESMEGEE